MPREDIAPCEFLNDDQALSFPNQFDAGPGKNITIKACIANNRSDAISDAGIRLGRCISSEKSSDGETDPITMDSPEARIAAGEEKEVEIQVRVADRTAAPDVYLCQIRFEGKVEDQTVIMAEQQIIIRVRT